MKTDIRTNYDIQLNTWQDAFRSRLQDDYDARSTVNTALGHVRVFTRWFEAQFNTPFTPMAITNYALRQYQRHSLDEAQVSPNTWNSRLWALTLFTDWIETIYGASFADLMTGCKIKEHVNYASAYRSLSEKQIHDLLQQLERNIRGSITAFEYQVNLRDSALVTLMLRTGLRVAEAAALGKSDITILDRSGWVEVHNGKGNKARKVPLNLEARDAMREYLKTISTTALFSGKNSKRLSTRQMERIVSYCGKQSGIDGMSPHWLRYTFAKSLERAGRPIEMMRDLLGHTSIETTRKYLRSSFAELQSAVEV